MITILMSIRRRHNANIESGEKDIELRTRPPKIKPPFRVLTYETLGEGGRGMVTNEWVCDKITEYNIKNEGVPAYIKIHGCISHSEVVKYTNKGEKVLSSLHISELRLYDKPRPLTDYYTVCKAYSLDDPIRYCEKCCYFVDARGYEYDESDCGCSGRKPITRPPQNWCYANERFLAKIKQHIK